MGATHIQCGITNHRTNREPLDAESVLYSYSCLQNRLAMKDETQTHEGALYAGMITSIINDDEASYNGPWYISYQISGDEVEQVSYNADRLPTSTEVNSYVGGVKTEIENEVNEVLFSWGHLT